MKLYLKIIVALNKVIEYLVVVVLAILAFVVLGQIITRSLEISVPWLEEIARYSMIWVAFLGGAVACRRRTLIKVDVVYEIVSKKVAHILLCVVDVISIAFLCVALYSCYKYLPLGFNSSAASMSGIKMFWFYLCMPIGLGMMMLNTIANLLTRLKGGESQ